MDDLRQRPGDQPLPVPNDRLDVQSMVLADIVTRRELGIQRYGTPLQAGNGRDALRDAYEEALDLAMYLRQAIAERDGEAGVIPCQCVEHRAERRKARVEAPRG